jgi:hypothetical protein
MTGRKYLRNTEKTRRIKLRSLAGLRRMRYHRYVLEIRLLQVQGVSLGFSLSNILMFKEDVVVLLAIGVFT